MKKILLSLSLVFISVAAMAQLKLYEQFANGTFTANGNLNGINGWSSSGSGTDIQVDYNVTNTGSLVYDGYASGQTCLVLTGGSSAKTSIKPFNSTVATSANGTFFVSFLVNVASYGNTSTNGDYIFALQTAGNDRLGRFYIRRSSSSTINFGIRTDGGSQQWSSTSYNMGTTYLVVIRIDAFSNRTETSYLWINPSLATEPSTGSSITSDNSTRSFTSGTTVDEAYLRQGSGAHTTKIDAIKVAYGSGQSTTAANASAAWFNLDAAGAPLPVKLSNIKAYERQQGIQLDWTAYEEQNLANYEIERSADGRSFTTIGSVAGRNSAVETSYGFFDASPLAGVNFYRIKNVDLDGKNGFSNIVKVNLNKEVKGVSLYPNPVRGNAVAIQSADLAKGNYSITVYGSNGQQVTKQVLNHAGGSVNQTISLPSSLQPGIYNVQVMNNGVITFAKPFVVVK